MPTTDTEEPRQELRGAPRKQVRFNVVYRSGIQEGSGQLVNISHVGALLVSNSIHPSLGRLVKISFNAPDMDATIELTGTVVRETKDGFAIRFISVTKEFLQLMGDPT